MTPQNTSPNGGMRELQLALQRWELREDGAPFQTPTSVLQRVCLKDGPRAFLKVALCEEERRGAALLRWWSGEGAVRVLAQHEAAVLLECACGGQSLTEMSRTGEDAEACGRPLASLRRGRPARAYAAATMFSVAYRGDFYSRGLFFRGATVA